MFVHLCLNAAEAFTSQCTKSECNSTVQQANETEINGKEKLWHSQYNMHRFSLSLDVRFERCYLSEITWLSFLWIQFLHIRAPHTHTHTHSCGHESREVTPLPTGTEYRPAGCVFISFRWRGQRKVGEERHQQLSESHGPARQKSPGSLSQFLVTHTGKPCKYQNNKRLASSMFSSHIFPSHLWYIPARSSLSPNTLCTQSLHSDLHSFFLCSTHKMPSPSLIVNPASHSSLQLLLHTVYLPRN